MLGLGAQGLRGVRVARRANSERPLVFIAVVLQKAQGVRRAAEIRRRRETVMV